MRFLGKFRRTRRALANWAAGNNEREALLLGRLLSEQMCHKQHIKSFREVEFRVFSQFGDDGIIQWLVHQLAVVPRTFIEFGVSDYWESNTRFLLMNDNWSGYVLDGSTDNIEEIHNSYYYWRHDLIARAEFVTRENINDLLRTGPFSGEVGLLHIDLDGIDYWVWKEIDVVSPVVLIVEYNPVFGDERAITVPYQRDFRRNAAHYSNLYAGASLAALHGLAQERGYALVGCNTAGNNAYFVRRDRLGLPVRELTLAEAFVDSKLRESRDPSGRLDFLRGSERASRIKGLPVFNTRTGNEEAF